MPVHVHPRTGLLTLYLMTDSVAAEKAIANGPIEGESEKDDSGAYGLALVATPEKHGAFFASPAGAKLFALKLAELKKAD